MPLINAKKIKFKAPFSLFAFDIEFINSGTKEIVFISKNVTMTKD